MLIVNLFASNNKESSGPKDDDDGAVNPGSNLFVTGIHPRLSEAEVTKMFEKYGDVEKCQIMRDPHTKESRGFGFVKMVTPEQAEAAREGLQGENIDGRSLSIEKARRARPRTPTPGKYFGPPKRGNIPFPFQARFVIDALPDSRPRFEDRRRGGYGGGGQGRDDPYRYRSYDRGQDRGYDRGYDRRQEDRGYDRGHRPDERRHDDRGYGRDGDRGYERRDRDDGYSSRDRYGGRDDRERYGPRGGNGPAGYERDRYDRPTDRDNGRSRDAGSGGAAAYGDGASRSEPRDQ